MNSRFCLLGLLLFLMLPTSFVQAQTQSPEEFLGFKPGDRFSMHHQMVAYFEHVAATRDNVTLQYYGKTYELRPLLVAFVTSEENQGNLDDIRKNNLAITGLIDRDRNLDAPVITWLSYGIHGNESSSMEAAMQTLYELSDPENSNAAGWLEKSVVVIDPCLNPDGRDRYATWYNQMLGRTADPRLETREHNEPWPGGRPNHYYFDLNRDWAWQTQTESKQRGKLYNSWMPQIHADFHEMGHNSPYYFAPAAEPFHEAISGWQREFQTQIGKNHIRYFDEENWLYYTRESFDLFYPSYGDTWPTFNGAIGMTYEKAGHGRAGTSVITDEGDTLTLAERILHHHTVGLSTVEVAAHNSERVVSEFASYFDRAQSDPPGEYKSYIIKGDSNPQHLLTFTEFLKSQDIRFGNAPSTRRLNAYNYQTGETERISLDENDLVISAHQPKSILTQVLMEPQAVIVDSLTYDITAWSLPYAYNLNAYASTSRINPATETYRHPETEFRSSDEAYAYIIKWNSVNSVQFLAELLRKDIRIRSAARPFSIEGERYDYGTLVITRRGNEQHGDQFDEIIHSAAKNHRISLHGVETGYVSEGIDFGSNNMNHLKAPRIAMLAGNGISSTNFGEIWYFFDQVIEYPIANIDVAQLSQVDWHNYDLLILPNGNYNNAISDTQIEDLSRWLNNGGKIIAMENAIRFVADFDGMGDLSIRQQEDSDNEQADKLRIFSERHREATQNTVRGSIFKLEIDSTHPLGYGFDENYYTLKNNIIALDYLDSGWNVATLQENSWRSGYTGTEAKSLITNSLIFGTLGAGNGEVVIMTDNPLFRGFWHHGGLLFGNAVFMVGK